jgi:DNA-binding PadR family transcriptional regulator
MSVKASILAVLTMGDCHGYQLRQEIESRTGGTWSINVGQIYSTLDRLERDGLVYANQANSDGQTSYRITDLGRKEAELWFQTPLASGPDSRSELATKLALAVTIPGVEVSELIYSQRVQTMRALQSLTNAKRDSNHEDPNEIPWLLIADLNIFNCEAELRWLEHIEGTLAKSAARKLSTSQELQKPVKRGRPAKTNN